MQDAPPDTARIQQRNTSLAVQDDDLHRLIRVLAAVIRRGERWLLCQRPAHKRHGALWEFPGGKIENGESLLDAARRELHEELGVVVIAAGGVRYARRDPGSHFVIEFVDVEIEGEPKALEHQEVRWVALDEMGALDLAPSDRAFVQALPAGRRDEPSK